MDYFKSSLLEPSFDSSHYSTSSSSTLRVSASRAMADPVVTEAVGRGNPVVFFDVSIAGVPSGRMKIELFADVVPKTAENFRQVGGRSNETRHSCI